MEGTQGDEEGHRMLPKERRAQRHQRNGRCSGRLICYEHEQSCGVRGLIVVKCVLSRWHRGQQRPGGDEGC